LSKEYFIMPPIPFVARLSRSGKPGSSPSESVRRLSAVSPAGPARSFQVLQSSRAPAQLCLFLRPGAYDVK